jgi:hypothetical protein
VRKLNYRDLLIGVRVLDELRLGREESAVGFRRRLVIHPLIAFLALLGVTSVSGQTASAADWATSATFSNPTSVAVSYSGGVFVADAGNNGGGDNNGGGGGGANTSAAVRISKIKLSPHRGWVYADGYLNMQVQVTNKGNGIARGIDVYLSSSKKKVKVPRRLRFHKILPGWTNTKTFKVKVKRSARGWVMIQADGWGKRNRSFLRLIRPWWPR